MRNQADFLENLFRFLTLLKSMPSRSIASWARRRHEAGRKPFPPEIPRRDGSDVQDVDQGEILRLPPLEGSRSLVCVVASFLTFDAATPATILEQYRYSRLPVRGQEPHRITSNDASTPFRIVNNYLEVFTRKLHIVIVRTVSSARVDHFFCNFTFTV
ncbi:MAG TPA: hypothetical protein DEB39_10145 [Planctomycetaceae bacterium]|nr:hypothetical protein [Planctomycetaceae bacterium]